MDLDALSYLQLTTSVVLLMLFGMLWYRQHHRRRREVQRLARVRDGEPLTAPDRDMLFSQRQQILETLHGNTETLLSGRLEVRDVMSAAVHRVTPKTSVDEVARIMREKCLHHVLVCEHDGRLLGIISDRDLARVDADTAAEVMTPDPHTIEPDALVSPAVTLLIKQQLSCLPVVDGGRLCGVVTNTDLLMALQCTLQTLQRRAAEQRPESSEALATAASG